MPGVPERFKTDTCTGCKASITEVQMEQRLGLCEDCFKAFEEADQAIDEVSKTRLEEDLRDATREDMDPPILDEVDQDGWDR